MNLVRSDYPELVFGIAAPIGVHIDAICESLANELQIVRYQSHTIKITDLIGDFPSGVAKPSGQDFGSIISYKIDHANALCDQFAEPSVLARIAVREIRKLRFSHTHDDEVIPPRVAYIIRQLKRPQEVQLLRQIYGRQFILISAYGADVDRRNIISERLKRTLPTSTTTSEIASRTEQLIDRDAEEGADTGQHLRDTFHLGDVFIDGINKQEMDGKLHRFVQAFFGRTDTAPSKDEYGMYAAKSASLRSSDLSRQVGAAIFSDDGEIITQGCNEVPKAFGGTYWDGENPDFRDVVIGHDPNDAMKKEVLREVLERLDNSGLLSETAKQHGTPSVLLEVLCKKPTAEDIKRNDGTGSLLGSAFLDITEFGRIVHAEMCAVCDAARLGKSIKGATLYCTTFPCHNCTKHLLAAGIKRVVYIEPYPKSKAKDLHANEVAIEVEVQGKVSFVPFLGISPFRYRDIFQKGRRKEKSGAARRWVDDDNAPKPMLDAAFPSYLEVELAALLTFTGSLIASSGAANTPEASAG
tara:strand:+ start:3856 stop:5433 length:1578 start_codon:yes stop_codon:yes gene_type:complete